MWEKCAPDFGSTPAEEPTTHRNFRGWTELGDGRWYQGEVNINGERDGRGLTIDPSQFCTVALYKNGYHHGPFMRIFKDGFRQEGSYLDDKWNGKIIKTFPDGKIMVSYHEKVRYLYQQELVLEPQAEESLDTEAAEGLFQEDFQGEEIKEFD